jgi:ankyrin repeat protein
MVIRLADVPYEINEKIFMYLDTTTIHKIGKKNLSEYIWDRKRHETIQNAAKDGNIIGLKYIIKTRKMILTHKDYNKALHISITNGYLKIAKCLINEHGAEIYVNMDSILVWCVTHNHKSMVEYLIKEHGADINTYKNGILAWCSKNIHLDIASYLAQVYDAVYDDSEISNFVIDEHIAYIDYTIKAHSTDILGFDAYRTRNGHLNVVMYLIDRGADFHVNNNEALLQSAQNGHLNVVNHLVEWELH